MHVATVSPPSRGAWIEMALQKDAPAAKASPPSRGAWIEILVDLVFFCYRFVAPLAGGVD